MKDQLKTIVRDGSVLRQAAVEIVEVLAKHGLKHGEVQNVFDLVEHELGNSVISYINVLHNAQ